MTPPVLFELKLRFFDQSHPYLLDLAGAELLFESLPEGILAIDSFTLL